MNNKTGILISFFALFLTGAALAEVPEDFRFPRECTMTKAGYPVPLCGKPLTSTPIVIK